MEQNPSKYDPAATEEKWYACWMRHKLFKSVPDGREPYTVVIPPPNVTGVLHMGHMLNNTIQDILVRRARMAGKNACWVPGTDHASIATEAKVVAKLAAEGVAKADLTREQFLSHAWEWTHKHGGIILEQLKKLGASCDWDRTCFTMDEARSRSVIKTFVDLYNKGLIYRGVRMVNWDPAAQTAISDEEVIHREEHGKLYYIRYFVDEQRRPDDGAEKAFAVIATTRPETIYGDVAVCIHPDNPKTAHMKGKKLVVPLINRVVPVIEDRYVDMEFGTGFLKVTPAHDANDYMLGEKHRLEVIDIFNDDGTLNACCPGYEGTDRFEARRRIAVELEQRGLLEKAEPYTNSVGYSERTDVPIEPKLSMQWFLKMEQLAKPALEAVENGEIRFHPAKFRNMYRHWMSNIKDWNISRQLWWGHRIPAYYLPGGGLVVAETAEEALLPARRQTGNDRLQPEDLRQDEDCLDTWFSSWLWPISVFDGINRPDNEDVRYYYPTSDLVTAPEIIFFWVARMIMAGYEYRGAPCFRNVYFTGIVRDKLGRKMSKSLGNSPDPVELMNRYGADGVRMGMLLTSPAGNDLPFDEALCEQGRNFNNKIWNAFRLITGWQPDETLAQPVASMQAGEWFDALLSAAIAEVDDLFGKYRLSEALMCIYKLFWDEFSSWYLEMIKPDYRQPVDGKTRREALSFLEKLLHLLHPFMPFITEELWHRLGGRSDGESIMLSPLPLPGKQRPDLIDAFEQLKETVAAIRTVRREKNIPAREPLRLLVAGEAPFPELLRRMCCLSEITRADSPPENAIRFAVRATGFFVPTEGRIDAAEETGKLKAELQYQEEFLASVMKKLSNERFVNSAPAQVVELERKKKADAESRIRTLNSQIAGIAGS
ncbi:MAG: valine--tRNA ligase [Bacteroidales bacterium]|jgi:valyl-tRNA synthetase|nr:valine--tRNA ligase [Bacteroidales bacterium]